MPATSLGYVVQALKQQGTQRLTMAGAAQSATIAAGTNIVRLAAEAGDLRWDLVNTATATSAGYLPSGSIEILHIGADATLSIYGSTGAFADLVYLRG